MKLKEEQIEKLANGTAILKADHTKPEQMQEVLSEAFAKDNSTYVNYKDYKYYCKLRSGHWDFFTKLPVRLKDKEIIPLADFYTEDMGELDKYPKTTYCAYYDNGEKYCYDSLEEINTTMLSYVVDSNGVKYNYQLCKNPTGYVKGIFVKQEENKGYWAYYDNGDKLHFDSLENIQEKGLLHIVYLDSLIDIKVTKLDKGLTQFEAKDKSIFIAKPTTAEERDQLIKELQAMDFLPTLEEAIATLEEYEFDNSIEKAVEVVLKHLKTI